MNGQTVALAVNEGADIALTGTGKGAEAEDH
jgi:hypothetical protein